MELALSRERGSYADLAAFSDAIIAFWNYVPERTPQIDINNAPKWFSDAIKKDIAQREHTG
ncbi:MAG: hypothetical protein R3B95_19275 [Nitrospirales bacterium]|nr:hypothetical protein [Nitrospirales bacterium]